MHELSIARSIVELVEEQADNRGASVVEELELEIGHLSGVEIQTLAFALDSAIKGSKLEKARALGVRVVEEAEFLQMLGAAE